MKSIDAEKPNVMNCFLPVEWSWNPGIWTGLRDCPIQPARGNLSLDREGDLQLTQKARAELGSGAPSFRSRLPSCCIGVIRRDGRGGPASSELLPVVLVSSGGVAGVALPRLNSHWGQSPGAG